MAHNDLATVASTSSSSHFTDPDDEEDQSLAFYGSYISHIVGIQHYQGVVRKNEMVILTRAPDNSHDYCAIRVDNVQGQQIGHLRQEVARHLAPLIDHGQLRIEGLVPSVQEWKSKISVIINCFGPAADKAEVLEELRGTNIHMEEKSYEDVVGGGGGPNAPRMSPAELEASLDRLFEDLIHSRGPQELMQAHAEVLSLLHPHQQAALAWMVKRENCSSLPPFWTVECGADATNVSYVNYLTDFESQTRPASLRGGILADDTGLGKTLTVISLIASNRPGVPVPQAVVRGDDDVESPTKRPKVVTNCHTEAGDAGTSAAGSLTLQTQMEAKNKLAKLAAETEPPALPPAADGPKGTLIICPPSVLFDWVSQIEDHTAGNMKVYVFHGHRRTKDPTFLAQQDVVLTTYTTLAQEVNDAGEPTSMDGLLQVHWLRVVLDEAHTVRNANALQSKAARAVRAERRWAVTGTPIHKRIQDLYGLMAFLRMEPLHDHSLFDRTLQRPIKKRQPRGLKRLQVLMGSIAMRRTKDLQVDGRPIVELPSKTVHVCTVRLDPEDQLKYDRFEAEARSIISSHLSESTLLQNYTTVLQCILWLRQICDHGDMCPTDDLPAALASMRHSGMASGPAIATPELLTKLQAIIQVSNECAICLDEMEQPVITVCEHAFCRWCIEKVIVLDKPNCPMCRAHVTNADLYEAPPDAPEAAQDSLTPTGSRLGAKVAMLLSHLKAAREQTEPGQPPVKSIVFSQFTGMLGLAARALQQEGIPFLRLDGKTSANSRSEMLRSFASSAPDSPAVFLISLKAGGVGLNLTSASKVHLLDPWWNPAVEEQAMDRVHRLGQTRAVDVYRYVAENTIEERMLQLQERKRELAKAAFERKSSDQQRQMRIEDVKLLMSL